MHAPPAHTHTGLDIQNRRYSYQNVKRRTQSVNRIFKQPIVLMQITTQKFYCYLSSRKKVTAVQVTAKSESIPIDSNVKMSNFKALKSISKGWYRKTVSTSISFLLQISSGSVNLFNTHSSGHWNKGVGCFWLAVVPARTGVATWYLPGVTCTN